jgi:hypothetical protein
MTQDIIEGLKLRVPFYDRYILTKDEKKEKNHCIIDRVYSNQVYHTFSLILRDSIPETFSSNLLNPDKWIDTTRDAVKKRKTSIKKNDIYKMDVIDHRTEAAAKGTNEQTIRKALKEAHEILFETEFDELPLVSYIKGWEFLRSARYEIEAGSINTKTKVLQDAPQEANSIAKGK